MTNPLNAVEPECNYASPGSTFKWLSSMPKPDQAYQPVLPDSSVSDLPAHFPDVEMPRFLYGDRLRWLSNGETTDWGIAIGRFYSFAPQRHSWRWCYLIWLDPDSPSAV